jgi:hypothetical protein
MKRILILVEGQTEETFVRDVLNPYLTGMEKCLIPTLVVTKRVKNGPNFKGGITSWAKVQGDLGRLFCDTNAVAVTTMFDYYGLPPQFPGMGTRPPGSCTMRVQHVEQALSATVGNNKFKPYLALHEFEALVFASLGHAGFVFNDDRAVLNKLQRHLVGVSSPEEINENPATAPSKRIEAEFPGYQKVLQGPMAVASAGLAILRQSCPHFASWLGWLETL